MRIVGRPALGPPPFAGNAIVFARRGEAPRPADGYGEPSVGGDVGIATPLFGAATRLADVDDKNRAGGAPLALFPYGAGDRTRTGTLSPAVDFELFAPHGTQTNSAP